MNKIISLENKRKDKEIEKQLLEEQLNKLRTKRKTFKFNYKEVLEIIYCFFSQIECTFDTIRDLLRDIESSPDNNEYICEEIFGYSEYVYEYVKGINKFTRIYSSINSVDYVNCTLSSKYISLLTSVFEMEADIYMDVKEFGESEYVDTICYLYSIFKKCDLELHDKYFSIREQLNKQPRKKQKPPTSLELTLKEDMEQRRIIFMNKLNACEQHYLNTYKKPTFVYEGTWYLCGKPFDNNYYILNGQFIASKLKCCDKYFQYVSGWEIEELSKYYDFNPGWRFSHRIELDDEYDFEDGEYIGEYYIEDYYYEEEQFINEIVVKELNMDSGSYNILNMEKVQDISSDIAYKFERLRDNLENLYYLLCDLRELDYPNNKIRNQINKTLSYFDSHLGYLI